MKAHRNIGYLGGVFDMFRVEHLDQIKSARGQCDLLIVGVLSDESVGERTGKSPIIPFAERLEVVRSMREVDVAIGQMSNDLLTVWDQIRYDTLFLTYPHIVPGDNAYTELVSLGVDLVDLPRTRQSGNQFFAVVVA